VRASLIGRWRFFFFLLLLGFDGLIDMISAVDDTTDEVRFGVSRSLLTAQLTTTT
jgi:hypothetical protein